MTKTLTSVNFQATKSGGTIVKVGYGHQMAKLPIVTAAVKEVDIKGTHRYANW